MVIRSEIPLNSEGECSGSLNCSESHIDAQQTLESGIQALLRDSSKEEHIRLRIASNVLHSAACPPHVHRLAADWLLSRCNVDTQHGGSPAAVVTIAECLPSPGLSQLVAQDRRLLLQLLAAVLSTERVHRRQLCLSRLQPEQLMVAVAEAATAVTAASTDRAAALLFRHLCELLSCPAAVLGLGSASQRRDAYLRHLLVPSLRVSACRPDLTDSCAAAFSALALSEGDVAHQLLQLAERPADDGAEPVQLLAALHNLSAAEPAVGAEMMAVLGAALLRAGRPLLTVALLASHIGFQPTTLTPDGRAARTRLLPMPQPPAAPLPVETRLLLLGRLCSCVSERRPPLTARHGQVTLLEWLRTLAADLLCDQQLHTASAWFDCMCQLLHISPLVVPLLSRLGHLVAVAMETAAGDSPAAPAAVRLLELVMSTYAELHQLPKLVPQLLQAARAHAGLTLLPAQWRTLGRRLSAMPQAHVAPLWKTLLYHLSEDVLSPLRDGASPVSVLTLQLAACFWAHVSVIDHTTTTAATRRQSAELMSLSYSSLSQVAAAATGGGRAPAAAVAPLLTACVAWCQLHLALLQYCAEYGAELGQLSCGRLLGPFTTAAGDWQTEHATDELGPALRDAAYVCSMERDDVSTATVLSEAAAPADGEDISAATQRHWVLSGMCDSANVLGMGVIALTKKLLKLLKESGHSDSKPYDIASCLLKTAVHGAKQKDSAKKRTKNAVDASTLEAVGEMLSSDTELALHQSSLSELVCAALQNLLNLPLEGASPPWFSHLLAIACLCLTLNVDDRGSKSGKRKCSTAAAASSKKQKREEASGAVTVVLAVGADADHCVDNWQRPRQLAAAVLTAQLHSCRRQPPALAALRALGPRSLLQWLDSRAAGQAWSRRLTGALLAACAGPAVVELSGHADELVASAGDGTLPLDSVGALVQLLQHYVACNDELKGSDPDVKNYAKSLSTCLPQVVAASGVSMADLPADTVARLFSGWALLVRLRAHKPSRSSSRPQWRRLLAQLVPLALNCVENATPSENSTSATLSGELVQEHVSGAIGDAPSWTETDQNGSASAGLWEAWSLLSTVCAHRQLLTAQLPDSLLLDAWRCGLTAPAAPPPSVTTCLLTAASDTELEQMLTQLRHVSETYYREQSRGWWRLLTLWRALAETVFAETAVRRRRAQRTALQWLVRQLARVIGCHPVWGAAGTADRLAPALAAVCAVVRQRAVVVSDQTLTAALLLCRFELSADVPTQTAGGLLRAAALLLERLCEAQRGFVVNRIPLLTQAICGVLERTCGRGAAAAESAAAAAALLPAANGCGRALRALCRLRENVEPVVPHVAANLLQLLAAGDAPLPAPLQEALQRSLYLLLSLCRPENVQRLRLTVPATLRPLLHTTLTAYRRYFKFTGRV